jgi:hypothetical protein
MKNKKKIEILAGQLFDLNAKISELESIRKEVKSELTELIETGETFELSALNVVLVKTTESKKTVSLKTIEENNPSLFQKLINFNLINESIYDVFRFRKLAK